jgi:hypothetical protein
MQAIKLKAHVGRDHRIELELPAEIPEGDVEVIILAVGPLDQAKARFRTLREFNDWLRQQPSTGRSKEEIDAYIAAERASWD